MYKIKFTKAAEKQIGKLQKNLQEKIVNKISLLANNPFPHGAKPIRDRKELIRLRYGDYRIIYTIKEKELIIIIVKISHRDDIYKNIFKLKF